jgi:hypothetical protein
VARVGDCSWPPPGDLVRGLVPFLVECRKVTLVDCSYEGSRWQTRGGVNSLV